MFVVTLLYLVLFVFCNSHYHQAKNNVKDARARQIEDVTSDSGMAGDRFNLIHMQFNSLSKIYSNRQRKW